MPLRCLADFLERLDAAGQLRRVAVEVAADEEIAEIARRVPAGSGPALLFQNVAARKFPLAVNLLGAERRIAIGLGVDNVDEAARRLAGPEDRARGGWLDWLKSGLQSNASEPWAPRAVRTAACQQVVRLGRDIELSDLPAIRCSPGEAGPSLYGACVVHGGVDPATRSLGLFDLAVVDRARLAIRWAPYEPIAQHWEACRAAGQKLPVAVLLGVVPSLSIAAASALYHGDADPYGMAGLLGAEPIDVVTCRSHALQVPAEADLVLEGFIDPAEPMPEGASPGCGGGLVRLPSPAYAIQLTAISHRADPVVTGMVPHTTPDECSVLAGAVARLWLPVTRRAIPDLVDLQLSGSATGQLAVLSIRKHYAGQARRVAAAWWGQLSSAATKCAVIVDDHIDVRDSAAVFRAALGNADPMRDVIFLEGPADPRDHSLDEPQRARRMAIDATTKVAGEHARGWPTSAQPSAEVCQRVAERWAEYGLG